MVKYYVQQVCLPDIYLEAAWLPGTDWRPYTVQILLQASEVGGGGGWRGVNGFSHYYSGTLFFNEKLLIGNIAPAVSNHWDAQSKDL